MACFAREEIDKAREITTELACRVRVSPVFVVQPIAQYTSRPINRTSTVETVVETRRTDSSVEQCSVRRGTSTRRADHSVERTAIH